VKNQILDPGVGYA